MPSNADLQRPDSANESYLGELKSSLSAYQRISVEWHQHRRAASAQFDNHGGIYSDLIVRRTGDQVPNGSSYHTRLACEARIHEQARALVERAAFSPFWASRM